MSRVPGGVLALGAAACWGLTAVVAKDVFIAIPPLRLAQWRAAVAAVLLVGLVLAVDRDGVARLWRHRGATVLLGVALAAVNATYYLAIERLPVGVGITLQYVGPVLVLVVRRHAIGFRLWVTAALALVGVALVSGAGTEAPSDPLGVVFGLGAAVSFAAYLMVGERLTRAVGSLPAVAGGFAAATLAWSVVMPWWEFPFASLGDAGVAGRAGVVGVVGTAVPFLLLLVALRTIPAGLAGVVATAEPAFGALFAFALIGETLLAAQVVGMLVTSVAVAGAQTAAERAPAVPPSASG